MITRETAILPRQASTCQLLLDAAGAWPDGIATQWIPDPADHTRCLAWAYKELAGTVTRIANALTALGVRRGDAVTLAGVNTSMLYAATLAAQAAGIAAPVNPVLSGERLAELIRHAQPLPRAVHLDDEVARTLDRPGVSEGFLGRSRPGSGLRLLDGQAL
jgi:acyl-coenzyme A synthetase/AMP-(fatty) acid ligase